MAINWQAQSLAQTQSQSNNADVAMSKILKKKQTKPMMMQGTPLKHFIYELDWISKPLKILVLI